LPEPVTSSVPSSGPGQEEPPAPGTSPLDDVLVDLGAILDEGNEAADSQGTGVEPAASTNEEA